MLTKESQFEGFSAETVFFLKNLKENNNQEWFLARKKDYNKKVIKPAMEFVVEMGKMLEKISSEINAEPKINRSIRRIYQDTRNMSDQDPYKTFLGICFWQGKRKTHDSPGYYFELRPEALYLAAGNKIFSRKNLTAFRQAVSKQEIGDQLLGIMEKLKSKNDYKISKPFYKRIPEGYKVSDKFEDLIRFNGLLASTEIQIPPELYSQNILKFVFNIFKDFAPLENWLYKHVHFGEE